MDNQAVNIEFLKSVIGDDAEFEKELFSIFIENAKENIKKMEDATTGTSNHSWYMASHAFKGAAASIGAFELSKILEHAQQNPEAAAEQKNEIVAKVKAEFDAVLKCLDQELKSRVS